MTNTSKAIYPEDTLAKLCTGLSLVKYPIQELPGILELGISELQALSIDHTGKSLPTGMNHIFELFEKSLHDWWPGPVPSDENSPLIVFEEPTSLCMDFAIEGRFQIDRQIAEIDEHVMLDILRDSRSDPAYQEQYVATRAFLINHPVATEDELMKDILSGKLNSKIQKAYEPIPSNAIRDGFCYICEHCGDTLLWHHTSPLCRNWATCHRKGRYSNKKRINASGLLRARRGILAYVTLPGKYELELKENLRILGLNAELWPGVDQFDLGLPINGAYWAIDVKASRAPRLLGHIEAQKGFIANHGGKLSWDRAFYVIPDEYFYTGYGKEFLTGAGVPAKKLVESKTYIMAISDFLKTVNGEMVDA